LALWSSCSIMYWPFGLLAPKDFNYLAFQSFDFDLNWCRLFKIYVVLTQFR
jgi:hypothetical protein